MFHKILVAAGGSPWSNNAVGHAIRLATSLHAELVIVHIFEDDPPFQPQGTPTTDPQLKAQIEASGRLILEHAAQRAAQEHLSHYTVSIWGSIPEHIVQIAIQEQCDLVVMGTRHLIGEKRLMTGRICNTVIATAHCPILVVPFSQSMHDK
jgi:nucleotide-binding universal stress UspA family protein